MSKTRVLVVDDHPFFRNGVARWLDQQPTLTCCGEAGSLAETRRLVAELRPDVILLDLNLADGDGLDLARELSETHPQSRVIALSHHDQAVYSHRALQAGARGYVMKSDAAETVLTAIQTVLRGDVYVR